MENKREHEKVDPYQEALVIQENYGLLSNIAEWENEKFLNYLKSVDEETFKKYIEYKKTYEREVIEEKNLAHELWEAWETSENEVKNDLLKTEKKEKGNWVNRNRKKVMQEMER